MINFGLRSLRRSSQVVFFNSLATVNQPSLTHRKNHAHVTQSIDIQQKTFSKVVEALSHVDHFGSPHDSAFSTEIPEMTYGRARLWLGIVGVGSLVTIAAIALILELPQKMLETSPRLGLPEFLQLVAVIGAVTLWLLPMDIIGGFLLPKKFKKTDESFLEWLRNYFGTAFIQALLFVFCGVMILLSGRTYGVTGGLAAIGVLMIACIAARDRFVRSRNLKLETSAGKLDEAITKTQTWQICVPRIVIMEHNDLGFTGGVIGAGKNVEIVIPKAWLSFDTEELATIISRRALAVSSGSYMRGLVAAFFWNLTGIWLCSFLTGSGLDSVSGLVTTVCGFTIWSFFGLLILPTVSRNASLKIDQSLLSRGMPSEMISSAASRMDQLQDDEPERPRLIETIFHPVPSVKGRSSNGSVSRIEAWNVARTSLFFSWACLGFLSRSVHCNLGRPELWTMLPTD